MIGFLRGKLLRKTPPQLLLDVQGVGYEVEAPMSTFYNLPMPGESVELFTHLIVREDAHSLFGFGSEAERSLFRALIKVNGVGPKLALTILSGLTVDEFHHCVDGNDAKALVRLPGVGQKTAERLLIDMRGRLPDLHQASMSAANPQTQRASPTASPKQEALSALCALGYKPQDATRMVQAIAGDDLGCEDIIRLALKGTLK